MVLHTLYTDIIKPSGYFYGNEDVTNSDPAMLIVVLRVDFLGGGVIYEI